jgi:hypothetical protein
MNKLYIIFTFLILFTFKNYGQEMTCADFKNGTFTVPANEIMPLSYTIIREGNMQTEIVHDPNNTLGDDFSKNSYEIIEWIDDCTYRVKYDETKMELSEFQQFMNDNNGILTELLKIEGKCFYFKSTLVVEGETQRLDGKFCAE